MSTCLHFDPSHTGFAKTMLDVADNLALALTNMPSEAKSGDGSELKLVRDGVMMVDKILAKSLETHGVVKVID
jgi:molecular chaperone GrpE (heat shock protein)